MPRGLEQLPLCHETLHESSTAPHSEQICLYPFLSYFSYHFGLFHSTMRSFLGEFYSSLSFITRNLSRPTLSSYSLLPACTIDSHFTPNFTRFAEDMGSSSPSKNFCWQAQNRHVSDLWLNDENSLVKCISSSPPISALSPEPSWYAVFKPQFYPSHVLEIGCYAPMIYEEGLKVADIKQIVLIIKSWGLVSFLSFQFAFGLHIQV